MYIKNSEYYSVINPVINSAKGALDMLCTAGIQEAIELHDLLKKDGIKTSGLSEKQNLLIWALSVIYELRYHSINYYIKKLGIKNIIDLGCGYSPRGLIYSKSTGYSYCGIDLPGVINELRMIDGNIDYKAVDITNLNELKAVLKNINGSVLFITEGVLPYLTKSELGTVISNIHELLWIHKGAWITPDFIAADYGSAVLKAVFDDRSYEALSQTVKQIHKASMGTEFNDEVPPAFKFGLDMMNEKGFLMKEVPFINDEIVASSMKVIPSDVRQKIVRNFSEFKLMSFHVDPESKDKRENNSTGSSEFLINANHSGDTVTISLTGRLDTISAPELIGYYEGFGKIKKNIIIDCSKLEYISSAGLRAFLIMYKGNDKNVKVINANSIVDEVLEQTGFKGFLC